MKGFTKDKNDEVKLTPHTIEISNLPKIIVEKQIKQLLEASTGDNYKKIKNVIHSH